MKNLTCLALAVLILAPCAGQTDTGDLSSLQREIATQRAEIEAQREQLRQQQARLDEQAAALETLANRLTLTASAPTPQPSASSAPAAVAASTPPAPVDVPVDVAARQAGDIKETHQLMTGDELVNDEFPGSWPMFGTNMRMKIGGYLKADAVVDFDGTRDPTQFLMSTIPVKGSPGYGDDMYFKAFAKETRFNFDIRRVTPDAVPLRAFFEGDFFSAGNNFRLRHAYITVNNFIIGQNWTTLSFLESLPFMMDFAAGDALFGGRTTQIRYQHKVNDQWKLSAALEDLPLLGIENANNLPGKATSQVPVFALRADYKWDSGLLLLGTSVAQLHWDGGLAGTSDSAIQYDFVVAGRQQLNSHSYLTWNVSYGEGSGENVLAFAGSHANAVLTSAGQLETFPALSALVGYGIHWSDTLSSNFSYAYGTLDTPDSRDPLALKRGGIGHVNIIWQPVPQFSTGFEYMWGKIRSHNDATGTADRLQGMAKFQF